MQKCTYFCSVSLSTDKEQSETVCYKVQKKSPHSMDDRLISDVAIAAVDLFAVEHIFTGISLSGEGRVKVHVCDRNSSHLGERTVLVSIRADGVIRSQRIVECDPAPATGLDVRLTKLVLFCKAEETMDEIRKLMSVAL